MLVQKIKIWYYVQLPFKDLRSWIFETEYMKHLSLNKFNSFWVSSHESKVFASFKRARLKSISLLSAHRPPQSNNLMRTWSQNLSHVNLQQPSKNCLSTVEVGITHDPQSPVKRHTNQESQTRPCRSLVGPKGKCLMLKKRNGYQAKEASFALLLGR